MLHQGLESLHLESPRMTKVCMICTARQDVRLYFTLESLAILHCMQYLLTAGYCCSTKESTRLSIKSTLSLAPHPYNLEGHCQKFNMFLNSWYGHQNQIQWSHRAYSEPYIVQVLLYPHSRTKSSASPKQEHFQFTLLPYHHTGQLSTYHQLSSIKSIH